MRALPEITTLVLASDHAGFALKQAIKSALVGARANAARAEPTMIDVGTDSDQSCDYPVFATQSAICLRTHPDAIGIVICGSGIGMSIAMNRFAHVRGARCLTVEDAELARQHNHANVLILSARQTDLALSLAIVEMFLRTPVSQAERHQRRVAMLAQAPE